MTYCVYIHRKERGPTTGEVFYVGFASSIKRPYETRRIEQPKWMNYFKKYGRIVEIVEEFDIAEDAYSLEFYLITSYKALGTELANIVNGGIGPVGYKHTPEAIRKLSESHKGIIQSQEWVANRANTQIGAKRSEESKKRMSAGQKKRIRTPEEIAKMTASLQGRIMTDTHKARLSEASVARWARRQEIEYIPPAWVTAWKLKQGLLD